MEQLIREGKVIYVGSSNFAGWDIAAGARPRAPLPGPGLRAEPLQPDAAHRRAGGDPGCVTTAWASPWSPLGTGLLGGVLRAGEGRRLVVTCAKRGSTDCARKLEAYEALCDELGEAPADIALAWLLPQSGRHRRDQRPPHRRTSSPRQRT